jgi:hypothetical protein
MRLSLLARGALSANPVVQVLISVGLAIGSVVMEHYAKKWWHRCQQKNAHYRG